MKFEFQKFQKMKLELNYELQQIPNSGVFSKGIFNYAPSQKKQENKKHCAGTKTNLLNFVWHKMFVIATICK